MSALRILAVAGCRPNFVKLAPLLAEVRRREGLEALLVHTGQHYDARMSDAFFRDLEMPEPDFHLGVGSGSQAAQTARVLERIEPILLAKSPDLLMVVGDVNSTVAASLAAVKLGIPVAHVEAGLRSFDREMPEEINRIVTDGISDLLFASEPSGVENLRREGAAEERIRFVGNVMVDALLGSLERIRASRALEEWSLSPRGYAVLTLHRPENVDDPERAAALVEALLRLDQRLPILFPVHPRTRERFRASGAWRRLEEARSLRLAPPLGYLDFLRLVEQAALVLTDSGGLQEETTALGVPCLTLRPSTERPATVEHGSNRLVGRDPDAIVAAALEALDAAAAQPDRGEPRRPELWDGRASARIADVLVADADRLRGLYRSLRARTTCGRTLSSAA